MIKTYLADNTYFQDVVLKSYHDAAMLEKDEHIRRLENTIFNLEQLNDVIKSDLSRKLEIARKALEFYREKSPVDMDWGDYARKALEDIES